MDRAHLRAEDRVILLHFLREDNRIDRRSVQLAHVGMLRADADRCQKRADTDPGRAKVIDFIDLQAGIDLVGSCQDILYLIGCDSVNTAAK